ncbi:Helix-turn-helix domain-containing protein [Nonomuraea jiangxiensis]|uniref:Helix-turn-helix domain-containing protein n=1 Tax=Nonomuraea jiangxiensis TaxID=633440 RepID=A0A1G9MLI7_9ACTN|nr:Helix-turn-helix domain-containing protein [Nonomuraea jiangxiensis]
MGDRVEEYAPADLTLIGPETPHTYQSVPGTIRNEAIVVQFRRDFLGAGFFDRPEFTGVAALPERSARGLSFPPSAVEPGALRALAAGGTMPPPERTLALVGVLVAPASVSRFFRRTTGATITGYLTMLRISAACRLLRETDRAVSAIAADCGYANLSTFNRRFRERTGMSPREYRAHWSSGTSPDPPPVGPDRIPV